MSTVACRAISSADCLAFDVAASFTDAFVDDPMSDYACT